MLWRCPIPAGIEVFLRSDRPDQKNSFSLRSSRSLARLSERSERAVDCLKNTLTAKDAKKNVGSRRLGLRRPFAVRARSAVRRQTAYLAGRERIHGRSGCEVHEC